MDLQGGAVCGRRMGAGVWAGVSGAGVDVKRVELHSGVMIRGVR